MDRKLEAQTVIATVDTLRRRIEERFPQAGLAKACADLVRLGEDVAAAVRIVSRPYPWLRISIGILLALGLAAQVFLATTVELRSFVDEDLRFTNLFPAVEAAVNLLIIFGIGVFFLWTLEARLKRRKILAGLYELRSMAHVIDMHQLTKDPTVLVNPGPRTASSPQRTFTEFELIRYLDYCAEMQALTGKLAALYAQHSRDPLVITTVNDLEALTANLGRKIWQKITILHHLTEARAASSKVA